MTEERRTEILQAARASLSYREREMLRLKFGLGDCNTHSNEEIGRIFGLGEERVRQILMAAVAKCDCMTSELR
jgi:RNA polymerase primary sigma factor